MEFRPLFTDECFEKQGEVGLWLEIFDKNNNEKRNNPCFIKVKPPALYEVRLVVWDSDGLANKDANSSDVFYKVSIDEQSQSTDVHFNAWNGTCSFNWRMVLPVTYDETSDREQFVNIQAYDWDLFTPNDFIAQNALSLKKMLIDCDKYDLPVKLDQEYFENWKKLGSMPEDMEKMITFEDSSDLTKFYLNLKFGTNQVRKFSFFLNFIRNR